MSTAAVHSHHRLSRQIAMAAAGTIVVVGGATAIGVAVTQDDPATPIAPAQVPDACRVSACMPSHIGKGDFNLSHGRHASPPLKGGHVVPGLP
jgi:hypothetical protein